MLAISCIIDFQLKRFRAFFDEGHFHKNFRSLFGRSHVWRHPVSIPGTLKESAKTIYMCKENFRFAQK